jgi:transposase
MMELFSHQGEPEDKELFQQVMQHEDTLEKEMWDLRLGPAIWDRIRNQFPEDILTDENKVEIQNYLLVEIFKLPARRFLTLMKEVISGSESGKRLLQQIVNAINQTLNDQNYEETMAQFNDELETIESETEEDDLKDFLTNLGINLSDDNEEDDDDGGEMVPR